MLYKFSGDSSEIPNPETLSNTERAMLREMAQPGGPLWKVFRSMVDFGEGLSQSLIGSDLLDPQQVNAARKTQATIIAVAWVMETFEQALTDQPVSQEEKQDE